MCHNEEPQYGCNEDLVQPKLHTHTNFRQQWPWPTLVTDENKMHKPAGFTMDCICCSSKPAHFGSYPRFLNLPSLQLLRTAGHAEASLRPGLALGEGKRRVPSNQDGLWSRGFGSSDDLSLNRPSLDPLPCPRISARLLKPREKATGI